MSGREQKSLWHAAEMSAPKSRLGDEDKVYLAGRFRRAICRRLPDT